MQKNWYAVYTKPRCEKKVASLFTKRKIENFFPVNFRRIKSFRHIKILREPLFKSYVFVNTTLAEIDLLKQVSGVISILYWRGEPAVIKQDEIDAIKEFTRYYRYIELDRADVNIHDVARVVDSPSYSIKGNAFAVKNKTLKVSLPSLGYIMIAKIEDGNFFGSEVSYKANRLRIHNETGHR
ncbi:MAG: transcription termination/antitermination NusG family protein [Ginsengibacter sp.]